MRLRVKLFGMLRESVGRSVLELEVPSGATAGQVWERLVESHPRLQSADPGVAVNLEYASPDVVLGEGDEVAFLPPVAGGLGEMANTQYPMTNDWVVGYWRLDIGG